MTKAARVKRTYHKKRGILIAQMGGYCVRCGSEDKLEFHHTEEHEWLARKMNRLTRQRYYEIDYYSCILVLLCHECHLEIPPRRKFQNWNGNGKER